ncbi:cyclophilin-like fold protein [Streptomyces sp. NPDC046942]|uniref:cyclophilin-like fold protein n=1 Tax=Streptomyces sp. NPDC046942 TaxID=3155137 RepID=UPI0033FFF098
MFLAATGCTSPIPADGHGTSAATHSPSTGAHSTTAPDRTKDIMKLRLTVDDATYEATLNDSAASRDFAALLPLTLTLTDYASTEKISDLPKKLSTADAPSGTAAKPGDLTYYAPWGNLAIFYKSFGHAAGLVKLGEFTTGIEQFAKHRGDFKVTIATAD